MLQEQESDESLPELDREETETRNLFLQHLKDSYRAFEWVKIYFILNLFICVYIQLRIWYYVMAFVIYSRNTSKMNLSDPQNIVIQYKAILFANK